MKKKLTVLLADDHPLVRKGMASLLKGMGIADIILEAGDGKEALEISMKQPVDLFLLDFRMPGMDGYDIAKLILTRDPRKKVIVITMYTDAPLILNLFRVGVKGFLMKNSDIEEVETAIHKVMAGGFYYNDVLEGIIGSELKKVSLNKIPPLKFTKREMDIMQLLSIGKSSKEISKQLNLTLRTVETYRSRLLDKVGARNTSELLNYFHQNGLL